MRLAILDLETTGLETDKDLAIEVAIALYDVEARSLVSAWSSLFFCDVPNAAEEANGIPTALLATAPPREKVWRNVGVLLAKADAVVAHNADFDRSMTLPEVAAVRPWADSCRDMTWPRGKIGSSLVNLALAHGVGVVSAHRALTDVLTLSATFQRAQEMGADVPAMIAQALRPKVRVIGRQKFDENDVAKAHGFHWDGDAGVWWRSMPAEDVSSLPFPTEVP